VRRSYERYRSNAARCTLEPRLASASALHSKTGDGFVRETRLRGVRSRRHERSPLDGEQVSQVEVARCRPMLVGLSGAF
jgi:hypothetical protein